MFQLLEDPPLFPGEQEPATLADEFDRVALRQSLDSVAQQMRLHLAPEIRAVYLHHLARFAEDDGSAEVRECLRGLLKKPDTFLANIPYFDQWALMGTDGQFVSRVWGLPKHLETLSVSTGGEHLYVESVAFFDSSKPGITVWKQRIELACPPHTCIKITLPERAEP